MAEAFINVTEGSGKKLHGFDRTIGANTVIDEVGIIGEPYLASYRIRAASVSAATADAHVLQIMAGSSLKVYVRRIWVYQRSSATTAALATFDLLRLTTAGTGGGAITPALLDTVDSASGATAMTAPTAKGTELTVIDTQSCYFNQTVPATPPQTQALLAFFDFSDFRVKSLVIAAGTSNGIAVKIRNAIAGALVDTMAEIVEANF